jgi:hypothetical protein
MGLSPSVILNPITVLGTLPAALCCQIFRKQVVAEANFSDPPGTTDVLEWDNLDAPKDCFIGIISRLPNPLDSPVYSVSSAEAADLIDQSLGK